MDLLDEYRTLLSSIADAQRELAAADQALFSEAEAMGVARPVAESHRAPLAAPAQAPAALVCPQCRQPLPPDVPFCRFCGAPTGRPLAEEAPGGWGLIVTGRDALVPLEGALLIGRSPKCDLRLEDGKASRQHARIERRQEAYWITDLGSSNGVLVNGRRIQQPVCLDPGDQIQVGDTLLTVAAPPTVQAIDITVIHPPTPAVPAPAYVPPAAPPAPPEPSRSTPAQRAARCRQCGQPVSPHARFCTACGTPVEG